ncbi:hypothetical protein [Hymenobacter sp. BRD67]|uniref:hypothetical protein n=1 Tax=Hymenobacter sp. BRD67 TaxID=2675877 RepID=UPI0015655D74|nr:hypothetical protein [Hymenobacter sp. BRD67]QKG52212.1 hypothetical protein GKZ67_05795 [Hymenobacter sp. BRD67]
MARPAARAFKLVSWATGNTGLPFFIPSTTGRPACPGGAGRLPTWLGCFSSWPAPLPRNSSFALMTIAALRQQNLMQFEAVSGSRAYGTELPSSAWWGYS